MKKTENQIRELMVNGFYSDVDLPEPHQDQSEIQEKYDEMEGNESVYEDDERYTILRCTLIWKCQNLLTIKMVWQDHTL